MRRFGWRFVMIEQHPRMGTLCIERLRQVQDEQIEDVGVWPLAWRTQTYEPPAVGRQSGRDFRAEAKGELPLSAGGEVNRPEVVILIDAIPHRLDIGSLVGVADQPLTVRSPLRI